MLGVSESLTSVRRPKRVCHHDIDNPRDGMRKSYAHFQGEINNTSKKNVCKFKFPLSPLKHNRLGVEQIINVAFLVCQLGTGKGHDRRHNAVNLIFWPLLARIVGFRLCAA